MPDASLSLDGASVAIGTANGIVELWSTNPSARLARTAVSGGSVEALAFSPDRQQIAVAAFDGTIHLLSAALTSRGSLRAPGGKISCVTFDSTGHFLATGETRGTVQVWSLIERKLLGDPLVTNGGTIWSVSFSPNTQIVAAGSERGTIHLWMTFTGERRDPFQSHARRLRALTFAPDGRSVFSGQDDGSVRRWAVIPDTTLSSSIRELTLPALRSQVCRIANRNLSHEEWDRYIDSNTSYRETCRGLPGGDNGGD